MSPAWSTAWSVLRPPVSCGRLPGRWTSRWLTYIPRPASSMPTDCPASGRTCGPSTSYPTMRWPSCKPTLPSSMRSTTRLDTTMSATAPGRPPMRSTITRLRDLVPLRRLSTPEALRVAEAQADRLLRLSGITGPPLAEDVIAGIPRIHRAGRPCQSARRDSVVARALADPHQRRGQPRTATLEPGARTQAHPRSPVRDDPVLQGLHRTGRAGLRLLRRLPADAASLAAPRLVPGRPRRPNAGPALRRDPKSGQGPAPAGRPHRTNGPVPSEGGLR